MWTWQFNMTWKERELNHDNRKQQITCNRQLVNYTKGDIEAHFYIQEIVISMEHTRTQVGLQQKRAKKGWGVQEQFVPFHTKLVPQVRCKLLSNQSIYKFYKPSLHGIKVTIFSCKEDSMLEEEHSAAVAEIT